MLIDIARMLCPFLYAFATNRVELPNARGLGSNRYGMPSFCFLGRSLLVAGSVVSVSYISLQQGQILRFLPLYARNESRSVLVTSS